MFKACGSCTSPEFCEKNMCRRMVNKRAVESRLRKIPIGSFQTKALSPFIGKFGYPNVHVGILNPTSQDNALPDDPRSWARQNLQIQDIIEKRTDLMDSGKIAGVMETNRFTELAKEVAMSKKSVDAELELTRIPTFSVDLSEYSAPHGPRAAIERAELTENPHIERAIENAVADTDMKASTGISELFKKGYDETMLTRLLSVGDLGTAGRRKFVPTRWSITAVDDTIGKDIIDEITDAKEFEFQATFAGYLGNYYLIMALPGTWGYELFELRTDTPEDYHTDYESYQGRKTYAANTAGGYYAARLSILEYCKAERRRGNMLVIRCITDEYTTPLGVWVCREAARKSTEAKPIVFGDLDLMINYAKLIGMKKFGINLSPILKSSIIIKNRKTQTNLSAWQDG
ncbi:hypothetical protein H6504_00995 [Candidatus Woesearchaeota archaeon]|nr:hypothetical protein [Candidatus Woesearchaeota archaeon]